MARARFLIPIAAALFFVASLACWLSVQRRILAHGHDAEPSRHKARAPFMRNRAIDDDPRFFEREFEAPRPERRR